MDPTSPDQQEPKSPSFEIKSGDEVDLPTFCKTLNAVITDKRGQDDYTLEYLEELKAETGPIQNAFFLIEAEGKPVGVRWVTYNTETGSAYIPEAGIIEEYRSKGIYRNVVQKTEDVLRGLGVKVLLAEYEDPNYLDDPQKKDLARRRINFFQRLGVKMVNPDTVSYLRAGWDDYSKDDYKKVVSPIYVLGIKPLTGENDYFVEENGKEYVKKAVLRRLHTDIVSLDSGITDETELKEDFEAIKQFNQKLDKLPGDLVPLLPAPSERIVPSEISSE